MTMINVEEYDEVIVRVFESLEDFRERLVKSDYLTVDSELLEPLAELDENEVVMARIDFSQRKVIEVTHITEEWFKDHLFAKQN